jgi:uncharacterized protein YecE (DUF72 family)
MSFMARLYQTRLHDVLEKGSVGVEIFLGTQGWSYKDWVGTLYPPQTPARSYLMHYAQHFNAVELDTTFYGTPLPSRIALWDQSTPEGFVFTAKTPRTITHDRRLIDAGADFREFIGIMRGLGPKLGPILIQLPPDFTSDERAALEPFIAALPDDMSFAVEFRHRSWLTEETYDLLRRYRVAWTLIDLVYMPRQVEITSDFTYVRWLGDRRKIQRVHATQLDRRAELDAWADRLDDISSRIERMYGFVNNHYSGHSPADVRYLRRKLGMPEAPAANEVPEQGSLL